MTKVTVVVGESCFQIGPPIGARGRRCQPTATSQTQRMTHLDLMNGEPIRYSEEAWLISAGQRWVTATQIMSSSLGFFVGLSSEDNSNPLGGTMWRDCGSLVVIMIRIRLCVCVCDSIFLAELLAAAWIANDTVACLPLLIYLCVLKKEEEERAEVWGNDRHSRNRRVSAGSPGNKLSSPALLSPSRKRSPAAQRRPSIKAVTTPVRWCSDVSL